VLKRNLVIVFPDEWLSHSPTLLNLVHELKDFFNVRVVSIDDGVFSNSSLKDPGFSFIKVNRHLAVFFLRRIRVIYGVLKSILLVRELRKLAAVQRVDRVIGVDSIGLWAAQKVFGSAHFLSLELNRDSFFRSCRRDRVLSVAIQSEERASFLFSDPQPRLFLLPNAPILPEAFPGSLMNKKFNARLIYLGVILPTHGIYPCMDAMERIASTGATLTIKGVLYKDRVRRTLLSRYRHLFDRGAVVLDQEYLPQDDLLSFLSGFSAGFCFYDFSRISLKDFNYVSSPSGKLFNYYAAGVPIIGTHVLGLRSVLDFQAGILLKDHTPEAIGDAFENITRNFDFYRQNCLKAAAHFDFHRAVIPYREFLLSQGS
jgi:glycosyltransferase involved in cell wall biosynthesis